MGGVGVDWSLVAGLSSVQPDRWAALTLVVAVIRFSRVCSRFSWHIKVKTYSFAHDLHLPVNCECRHKQSNHKTVHSLKNDQSGRLFGQLP